MRFGMRLNLYVITEEVSNQKEKKEAIYSQPLRQDAIMKNAKTDSSQQVNDTPGLD